MLDAVMNVLGTKLPIGEAVAFVVDYMTATYSAEFRLFSAGVAGIIEALAWLLGALHPLIVIALATALAWFAKRSVATALFCLGGFLLIFNLGLWNEMVQTLALIVTATLFSLLVGIPLGIINAHSRIAFVISRPVLDFMQTIPPFVYLIPALMFFGLGEVPGVLATVVFAMPPAIRLTCLGIQQVPGELIEAGRAFGCNVWQMLYKIELPSAFPSIMMGINQTIMMSLSMVVIAALIGAGGLGAAVMRSLAVVDIGLGFESGLGIVILAMLLDRIIRAD